MKVICLPVVDNMCLNVLNRQEEAVGSAVVVGTWIAVCCCLDSEMTFGANLPKAACCTGAVGNDPISHSPVHLPIIVG